MSERKLSELSGPWGGFWLQDNQRGFMRLRLEFSGSRFSGAGEDSSGDFLVSGVFQEPSGEVMMDKRYSANAVSMGAVPHLIYSGFWTGTFIHGRWQDIATQWNTGEFELWPEDPESVEERQIVRHELTVLAPAGR